MFVLVFANSQLAFCAALIKNIIFIFLVSYRRQPRGGEKVGRPCQTILASSFSSLLLSPPAMDSVMQ
jgi:hypothetical protein